MTDTAIRVSKLSKCYQIYDNPQDRLKQSLIPRFQRLIGRKPTQYFQEFWALKDVSFEVKRGETVGIIGRNGSGKSTLLQIICGTLTPTSGTVETNGRIAALLELGSGFNPEFTGRENVFMNAALLGLKRDEVDNRFDDIAAFADIGQFIDQPVKTYSSGMYVRLAFAVIAHVDAEILVIDEALAVGDAFFTQKCMRFLRRFMEQGTVIFVSHDSGAVRNLCNRALWIHHGACKMAGHPKKVTECYLEALYESEQSTANSSENVPQFHEETGNVKDFRDPRLDFINASPLRNDIEVFRFDSNASGFGLGGAQVAGVVLEDNSGHPLAWVVGGELVRLRVICRANIAIQSPIVGFFVKDRLGQTLFGDNTYLSYQSRPLKLDAGQTFFASFEFRMPILPSGDYSICAAIAEGTQAEHKQHHWVHDAVIFKSHSTSASTGLVGIPMLRIDLA